MLMIDSLQAGYGHTPVLFDVSLSIASGEVVTLLGRNGMGKTTTIRTLMGLLPAAGGSMRFRERDLGSLAAEDRARLGLGLVPEGRQVFPTLSVVENLIATAANRRGVELPWTLRRIWALFPRLEERQHQIASTLSGGEQQMLAIGRALMTNPLLLILDEATEGLAPLIRADIWRCIAELKTQGQAILIVDKHLAALQRLADRHVIIEKGRTVWCGGSAEMAARPDLAQRYLGV